MVAIGVAIVREGAGQRCREEKWLERPCWWQRRGKDGKADRTNQLPRACPEPEPTCWCRLYLEASSFSSISVTCVVASSMPVPLTGTRHSNQMLTHPPRSSHFQCVIIHRFPVLLRLDKSRDSLR